MMKLVSRGQTAFFKDYISQSLHMVTPGQFIISFVNEVTLTYEE